MVLRTWQYIGSLDAGYEEFVRAHYARRKALLVDVAADRRQGRTVRLEAVGPEIGAEYAPRLLDMLDQPRQRDAQRIGVIQAADREVARFDERAVNAARRPRVLAIEVLAQRHGMHDRQDTRATVIVLFDLFIVRKQSRDRGRAVEKQLRDIERQQRVELARREHPLERLRAGEKIKPDVLGQIEGNQRRFDEGVEAAHEPVHVLRLDAVVVLQHAAHEHEAGR